MRSRTKVTMGRGRENAERQRPMSNAVGPVLKDKIDKVIKPVGLEE